MAKKIKSCDVPEASIQSAGVAKKMLPGLCRQTEEDAKGKSGKRGVLGDDAFLLVVAPGLC